MTMRVFTYSEARQNLAKPLDLAQDEEIEIRRRDGAAFSLTAKRQQAKSPFDVPGIQSTATMQDILDALAAAGLSGPGQAAAGSLACRDAARSPEADI